MEAERPKYKHGIAAWTAAVFISDNPGCTYRQIERHLIASGYPGNWRIMFTPRRARATMGSTTMGLFWTRELGLSEDGSSREVFRFTITPRGREFAEGPRPPTHAELQEAWQARKRSSRHPNDWVIDIRPHDLLVQRTNKSSMYWGGSGIRVGEEVLLPSGEYNQRFRYSMTRDEILMFVCLERQLEHNESYQRPIYTGQVRVVSCRTGEMIIVRAEMLKLAQRRVRKEAQ